MGYLETTLEDFGEAEFYRYLEQEWEYRRTGWPRIRGDYQPGLREGHYSGIIDNWLLHFPAEQLLVVFFEQIKEDPEGFLAAVCEHIGVRSDFEWSPEELRGRINPNPSLELPEEIRLFLEELYAEHNAKYGSSFQLPE